MGEKRIISDKEQKEWYTGCPVLITRNTITETDGAVSYHVSVLPCSAIKIGKLEIRTFFSDARRAPVDVSVYTIDMDSDSYLPCPETAVYAHAVVEKVYDTDHTPVWSKGDAEPLNLPEQEILWQTDPLYAQLRRECEGIVQPVYRPDTVDGGWRCTCGHINLNDRTVCGACNADHKWLLSHFDPEFLQKQQAVYEELQAKTPEKKKVNYKNEKDREDQRKMILILSTIATAAIFVILLFTLILPSIRYSNAEKALIAGDYDTAITAFSDLGGFRNAKTRMADAVYKKAQYLTGLDEVYLVTSEECPWFSITEDGLLSFRKDKYVGSWEHFIVPDMVDGIIVRELDRNFFLNCKEIVTVTLSDCIEVLGEQTFFNCEALTAVYFGSGIQTLGPRTFINCYSLVNIVIPDTVTSIGLRAFNSCTNLKNVTLGSGITELPSYLFSCCYALEEVTMRSPITKIASFAFSECPSMKKLTVAGTKTQWDAVIIEEENTILETVEIVLSN